MGTSLPYQKEFMNTNVIEAGHQNVRSNGRVKSMQLAAKMALVFDVTVDNTKAGAADCFVQLWDVDDAANIGASGFPSVPEEEHALLQGSFMPFSWSGGKQFWHGCYVRCVTAAGGSALITSADCQINGRLHSPYPITV